MQKFERCKDVEDISQCCKKAYLGIDFLKLIYTYRSRLHEDLSCLRMKSRFKYLYMSYFSHKICFRRHFFTSVGQ